MNPSPTFNRRRFTVAMHRLALWSVEVAAPKLVCIASVVLFWALLAFTFIAGGSHDRENISEPVACATAE